MNSIQIAQTSTEQTSLAAIPARILSKEQFLQMKATWASKKDHSAAEIIIYNALRGFTPSRGFTPLTDRKVQSRSNDKWDGFNKARYAANSLTLTNMPSYLKGDKHHEYVEIYESKFKATFGTELTTEIKGAIKAIEAL